MANPDQTIDGDNITNGQVELTQAGRDLKQIQGSDRSITVIQTFL